MNPNLFTAHTVVHALADAGLTAVILDCSLIWGETAVYRIERGFFNGDWG
jgi:hypothetical protein